MLCLGETEEDPSRRVGEVKGPTKGPCEEAGTQRKEKTVGCGVRNRQSDLFGFLRIRPRDMVPQFVQGDDLWLPQGRKENSAGHWPRDAR